MTRRAMQAELNAAAIAAVRKECEAVRDRGHEGYKWMAESILEILDSYRLPPNNPAVAGYNVR